MTLRKTAPVGPGARSAGLEFENSAHVATRLVGLGFRCWLAGYETHDVNCWETGWNVFARELGTVRAKAAVGELSCWVREVHKSSCRRIETYPFGCAGFCRDECMAISIVAAGQHSACPAMRACAFALTGTSEIDGIVDSATSFGNILRDTGFVLSHEAICDAAHVVAAGTHAQARAKH